MKPTQTTSDALVTRLLLLADGTVLADNLTPAMAELLQQLNLHTDPSTQRSLQHGASSLLDARNGGESPLGADRGSLSRSTLELPSAPATFRKPGADAAAAARLPAPAGDGRRNALQHGLGSGSRVSVGASTRANASRTSKQVP